jgi:hypothetical protein
MDEVPGLLIGFADVVGDIFFTSTDDDFTDFVGLFLFKCSLTLLYTTSSVIALPATTLPRVFLIFAGRTLSTMLFILGLGQLRNLA